jgi:hypothetical protein
MVSAGGKAAEKIAAPSAVVVDLNRYVRVC